MSGLHRPMSGPYETEPDAGQASLWYSDGRGMGIDRYPTNVIALAAALSGIELGVYDRQVIEWLSQYEPSKVTVICGLIERARAQGALR